MQSQLMQKTLIQRAAAYKNYRRNFCSQSKVQLQFPFLSSFLFITKAPTHYNKTHLLLGVVQFLASFDCFGFVCLQVCITYDTLLCSFLFCFVLSCFGFCCFAMFTPKSASSCSVFICTASRTQKLLSTLSANCYL